MLASPSEGHTAGTKLVEPVSTRHSYLLLLAALPLMPFANGTLSFPAAAWLAPALLLCFVCSRPGLL